MKKNKDGEIEFHQNLKFLYIVDANMRNWEIITKIKEIVSQYLRHWTRFKKMNERGKVLQTRRYLKYLQK